MQRSSLANASSSENNQTSHKTSSQMSTPSILRHIHLPGITPFARAQSLQQHLVSQFLTHKALVSSTSPPSPLPPPPQPTILSFTPTPVYTTGRRENDTLTPSQISLLKSPLEPLNSTPDNPNSEPEYAEIIPTLRGGQTTFHGPGQLVVYPILDLRSTFPKFPKGISVRCYVHLLESTTISTLAKWDIKGVRTENPGVWVEDEESKIAALGVHLRRNISSYGVGLNVNTDLRWFDRIVACGLVGKSVTTMSDLCRERDNFEEDVPDNLYTVLKPDAVGRVWMRGFARGLYGEGGEEKIREAGVEELELD